MKKLEETEKEYDDRLNRRKTTEQRTDELLFGDRQGHKHHFSDQFTTTFGILLSAFCASVFVFFFVNISNKFKRDNVT